MSSTHYTTPHTFTESPALNNPPVSAAPTYIKTNENSNREASVKKEIKMWGCAGVILRYYLHCWQVENLAGVRIH
jgi:hypothetical protein